MHFIKKKLTSVFVLLWRHSWYIQNIINFLQVHVSNLSNSDQLIAAVSDLNAFDEKELHQIAKQVDGKK